MTDEVEIAAIIERHARAICVKRKVDPDRIIDDYGPVYEWHIEAYHIDQARYEIATKASEDGWWLARFESSKPLADKGPGEQP